MERIDTLEHQIEKSFERMDDWMEQIARKANKHESLYALGQEIGVVIGRLDTLKYEYDAYGKHLRLYRKYRKKLESIERRLNHLGFDIRQTYRSA